MSTPKKILVIDVEATCWENLPPNKFPSTRNEIIEIGVTTVDIKTKTIEKAESILVKPPTTEISEFCTKLTTITPQMIEKDGISIAQAMDIMEDRYRLKQNIFASWGDYDRRSFEKNCQWAKFSNPVGNLILNVKALFAAKFGYCGGMDKCAADMRLTFEGTHHRGVDDSRMIARILLKLL
jgi:inhibitor of KinA sporulation pathway (predicted exonuclease)